MQGIPPFYISFVLAPLASNGTELLAAYQFALKKTSKSVTVSLSQLEGAAIMNNTFCLGIFLFLIYLQVRVSRTLLALLLVACSCASVCKIVPYISAHTIVPHRSS